MYRLNENDEYLLSRLLDNDLPADQAAGLRARLQTEPELRACFDSLGRLNTALERCRADQPRVDVDRLHADLMRTLEAPELSEADEFQVSRLIDGDLSEAEQLALSARMAAEPLLRESHRSLACVDALVAAKRAIQPSIDYGRFHEQVMHRLAQAASTGRSLLFPRWARIAAPLAAAAAILLVVWLGPSTSVQVAPPTSEAPGPVAVAPVPAVPADQDAVLEVTVSGPMNAVAYASLTQEVVVQLIEVRPEPAPVASVVMPSDRLNVPLPDGAAVQVSYARSAALANAIHEVDDEQASQPSRKVFLAVANPSGARPGQRMDGEDVAPM